MRDDLIPYRQGMEYGVGIDTPSGKSRNIGVLGTPSSIDNAPGSIVSFTLTQVSSDEDLQTALGVSASAGGGVGCFSASASVDFAQKCHVNSHSVFLLVLVEVSLAFSQIKKPEIDPAAATHLANGDSARFQDMYGDVFVRGLQRGGRYYAVAEITTSDRTEQESLSIALKGSYGPFSAQGSFSSSFSQAISNKALHITSTHEGGDVPKEATSLEEVQATASTFAATVEKNAVPYAALLDQYSILDLPNPPNYIDLQGQLDVLAFCAQQRNSIWTHLNDVDYILDNLGQFETGSGYDTGPLVAYRAALETDLTAVKVAASNALDHPKEAKNPVLAAVPPTFPERRKGEADALAAEGEALANADPLFSAVRDAQPVGDVRRGFYIGLVTEAHNTAWGPGAQSIMDHLPGGQAVGFRVGAQLSLQRNNNTVNAALGEKVLALDPEASAARQKHQPAGIYWLGFALGTALFGDPALGALGNTLPGPGSDKIRTSLDADGQHGFDEAKAFNLAKRHV